MKSNSTLNLKHQLSMGDMFTRISTVENKQPDSVTKIKRVTSVDAAPLSISIGRNSLADAGGLLRLPSEIKGVTKKKPQPRFTIDRVMPIRVGSLLQKPSEINARQSIAEIQSYETSSNHQWEISERGSSSSRYPIMGEIDQEWMKDVPPMRNLRSQYK